MRISVQKVIADAIEDYPSPLDSEDETQTAEIEF
jgi:hypothetical protein